MKKLILSFAAVTATFAAFSQVDIDKAINLSGSGSDAKITGIQEVNGAQDAVSAETVQKGALTYAGATGSGGAYAITLAPAISAYTAGQVLNFSANHANTGAATLNVNSIGDIAIVKNGSVALAADDIKSGQFVTVIYDGTNFQMVSHLGNAAGGGGGDPTLIYTTNGF
ncbi:MAG: hypothetical protein IT223_01140 [Crocinitomicaceae bacterium]|nr:hypothetical protein [Crocinitomicaceae bacterium]